MARTGWPWSGASIIFRTSFSVIWRGGGGHICNASSASLKIQTRASCAVAWVSPCGRGGGCKVTGCECCAGFGPNASRLSVSLAEALPLPVSLAEAPPLPVCEVRNPVGNCSAFFFHFSV